MHIYVSKLNIGSDNGLSPGQHQAIIWTNDGLVYWGIYVSLSFNVLNHDLISGKTKWILHVYP